MSHLQASTITYLHAAIRSNVVLLCSLLPSKRWHLGVWLIWLPDLRVTAGAEEQCSWINVIQYFVFARACVCSEQYDGSKSACLQACVRTLSCRASADRCCIAAAQSCRSRKRMCTCSSTYRSSVHTERSNSRLGTPLQLHYSASAPPQILVTAMRSSLTTIMRTSGVVICEWPRVHAVRWLEASGNSEYFWQMGWIPVLSHDT